MIPCDKWVLDKIENEQYNNSLYNKIIGIIEGVEEYCKNSYEDYIRTISINLYFKQGETAFDKVFQAFGREGKMIAMQTIDLLRKELSGGAELSSSELHNLITIDSKADSKVKKSKYSNLDKMKKLTAKIIPELAIKGQGIKYFCEES